MTCLLKAPGCAVGGMRCALRVLVRACAAFAVAVVLLVQAEQAFAAEGQPTVEVESLQASLLGASKSVDVSDRTEILRVSRFAPLALDAVCSPDVIQAGVDCGMEWMCGIEPCLCGSADAWGGCSCNGLVDVRPSVAFSSSDESVVRVVEAFGRTWVVPVGPGRAQLTVTPSLRYHTSQAVQVNVTVADVQAADVRLGLAVLASVVVVAAVCAGVVSAIRKRKDRCSR